MKRTNEYYIKEYTETRGLKKSTYNAMKYSLNHYSRYQNMSLPDLIQEADQEEEAGIRWKNRTLKKRLTNYMNHLKNNMELKSAKSYLTRVKGFYNHHEIEIGNLPQWNTRNIELRPPMKPEDLPTREIIRQAVDIAEPLMRALILFLVSTGMSKSDALKITIDDFITATQEYHQADNIQDVIMQLRKSPAEVIPVFEMRRTKNNKFFITFASPEAVEEICNYLLSRDKRNQKYKRPGLTGIDKLFKINGNVFTDKFNDLNDALKLGRVGCYNRFRGHMLRKYHATQLEANGMSREYVRTLQGKSNGAVDDVYFFADKEMLKKEYLKALAGVLIFTEVKEINNYSEEYQLLLLENEELKKQTQIIRDLEAEINNIKSWYRYGE